MKRHFKISVLLPNCIQSGVRSLGSVIAGLMMLLGATLYAGQVGLLNVSYDPTREFYQEFNQAFAKSWKVKTGDDVTIEDRKSVV